MLLLPLPCQFTDLHASEPRLHLFGPQSSTVFYFKAIYVTAYVYYK
jgi:hypothetical protein